MNRSLWAGLVALILCGACVLGTNATETGAESSTSSETDSSETDSSETDGCVDLCESPQTVADGIVRCADGSLNRVAPGNFEPTFKGVACVGDEELRSCTTDVDCNGAPHGACIHTLVYDFGSYISACECEYACASDDDCAPDEACVPPDVLDEAPAGPSCQRAWCRSNADCGPCGECALNGKIQLCVVPSAQLACRSMDDTCRSSAECLDLTPDTYCVTNGPSWSGWFCGTGYCD